MFPSIKCIRIASLALPVLVLGFGAAAYADTIYVCWDGSGDYLTIQEGIDAADHGDEVVVCDGTYTGEDNRDLDFAGKAITVRSASGDPDACIIDCQYAGRGFLFDSGETADAVVDGFKIENGSPGSNGGGVYCDGSSPTITNCTISDNEASYGGGVYCTGSASSPTITNCTISDNEAYYSGGGVYCDGSDATITNCTISGNSVSLCWGGGVHCVGQTSELTITNCRISDNSAVMGGGGVHCCTNAHAMITNCTISGNSADWSAPGGVETYFAAATLCNCILWGDSPHELSTGVPATYCDIQHDYVWPGDGNINDDPLFFDPDGPDDDPNTWEDNDYRLSAGSPCIDAANNDALPADTCDLDGDGDTEESIPYFLGGNPRRVDDPDTPDSGYPSGDAPHVDMGAYEYKPCVGDLDGDGDTDQGDLGILLAARQAATGEGDLDGDGDTDRSDLVILLADWGCGT